MMISIIIPIYNAENHLKRCLESVLAQTYEKIEVVAVNDGSSDGSLALLQDYAARDDRIKLIDQENTGVAGARNTGVQNATGEYIAWCDADDWVEPDWLESLYKHIVEYDADIAICRCQIDGRVSVNTGEVEIWDRDTAIKKFLEHKQLNGTLYNKLFKREAIEKGIFDEELSYFEDDKFFWQTMKTTNRMVRFHEEKYHIFYNPSSLTSRKCNDKRIRAVSVWEEIAADCKDTEYEKLANGQMVYQYFVLLLAMFRGKCFDSEVEKKMCIAIRHFFVEGIRLVEGMSHKLFYSLISIHVGLSRWLYGIVVNRR